MTESDIKGDKVIFDIFELQILIDIQNLFSLCRQIAVKGKIIFERDAGFFLYVVILENSQKFVKKKKKRLHRNYDVIDKWKMGTSNSVE